jgi:catechol 2,3-dioxygenase-like lactoylglutathione lyase family enzyme
MALRSHLLSAVRFADYGTGEISLAEELWRELPDDSLTIVDRNFLVADLLTNLVRSGANRHWLTRAKSTTKLKTVRRLGPDDELVEIELSPQTRRRVPELPAVWQARAIRYQRKGFAARRGRGGTASDQNRRYRSARPATRSPRRLHESAVEITTLPRIHIAFRADNRALVDAFYKAAIAAGGKDNGPPGLRPHYHKDYYGAFVLDPDGHNVEACCHTPG